MDSKVLIQTTLRQTARQKCPSTVEIYITAPISYLMLIAESIELEKVSLIDMKNLGIAW